LKEKIVTVLKCLLYALLAVLVVLCLFGLTSLMSWPWWVGCFLVLALTGILIGLWFLRRLQLRKQEQQFVQQVIEQDNERLESLAAQELTQGKELQERWKEAIDTLRRSHLKKQGNPLYVLPWYLMMGESGSGKSTAINSARLTTPFSAAQRASGVSGTGNCDWWFFEQSIIIDTAGRYAMPADPGRDNGEWQKFLSLLAKYRKKEPIHGVIMTVAADKLASGGTEALEEDGLQLRRRLDELMRVLGVSFPVYLLVTKCDLVQGMTQFSGRLAEKALNQPFGVVNQELSRDATSFVAGAMATLGERLKNLRIQLLQQQEQGALPPEALLFPDEFLALTRGLEIFARAAFQENRYQETPVLRGIHFSSGRQEGTPFSHFLNRLGLIGDHEVLPDTSKGLFLHDFFDKVLPSDRRLLAPTSRAAQWQLLTRNIGLTSWVVLWIALSGLMSYSFVKNMSTLRTATGVTANAPQLRGDFLADVATMDQYRRMILAVEEQNRNWWVPRFWLKQSLDAEARLKAQYCRQFQERFLASFDRGMGDAISGFSGATADDLAGQYLVHLTRRINLLKARLDQGGREALASRPLPSYVLASQPRPEEVEQAKRFGEPYLNYLVWRADSGEMRIELGILQGLLKHIVAVKGADLRWLPEWVNRQGCAPALTLQSFWGGSR
jgi:type VI secretion system protein ImpL